jgi:phosphoglucosamine mutase
MIIDETGQVADGDQIMALRRALGGGGRLADGTLVATVMSNLGLERFLAGRGCGWSAPGRRPLRGRGDARGRLEPGRRAVGPYRDDRLRHHRRRADRGLQFLAEMVETGQPASASWRGSSTRCRSC